MLRSKSPSGMCAKLRTVAESSNKVHSTRSLCYFLFVPRIMGVVLHPHSVRGESHIQRNASVEVATTSPPFYNEPYRSHVLFVKASYGTTSTSWSQHHFAAIGKARAACAHSFASWQKATIEFTRRDHSVIACSRHV